MLVEHEAAMLLRQWRISSTVVSHSVAIVVNVTRDRIGAVCRTLRQLFEPALRLLRAATSDQAVRTATLASMCRWERFPTPASESPTPFRS
jgi:hypothetical protein